MSNAILFIDGACEPKNPGGVASYGWVGYWKGKKAAHGFGVIGEGDGMTNNVAEYGALISAMKHLISKGYFGEVQFNSDSQLVVNQMSGSWKVSSPHIALLFSEAKELARNFDKVSFVWIPREENEEADTLSKKAYSDYRRTK